MFIFDAHCDTLLKLVDSNETLMSNSFCFDLTRVKHGFVQCFAAWVDMKRPDLSPKTQAQRMIDRYFSEIQVHSDHIAHCESRADIDDALAQNKTAALLTIEGGEALEGSIDNLHYFYELGVRALTLTWNYPNELCGDALTPFGREVVREMNRLNMLIDVSHLCERGFWEVVELSAQPIIATHSNSRALCDHPRNLTDGQAKAIFKSGGCIGVNFVPDFLSESGSASISDIFRHIEHFLSLGGENYIGFGGDFDGVDDLPERVTGVESYELIIEEMFKRNYSETLIEKILGKNFLNSCNFL